MLHSKDHALNYSYHVMVKRVKRAVVCIEANFCHINDCNCVLWYSVPITTIITIIMYH